MNAHNMHSIEWNVMVNGYRAGFLHPRPSLTLCLLYIQFQIAQIELRLTKAQNKNTVYSFRFANEKNNLYMI